MSKFPQITLLVSLKLGTDGLSRAIAIGGIIRSIRSMPLDWADRPRLDGQCSLLTAQHDENHPDYARIPSAERQDHEKSEIRMPTFTLNAALPIKTSKRLAGKVTAIDNMPANSEFPRS